MRSIYFCLVVIGFSTQLNAQQAQQQLEFDHAQELINIPSELKLNEQDLLSNDYIFNLPKELVSQQTEFTLQADPRKQRTVGLNNTIEALKEMKQTEFVSSLLDLLKPKVSKETTTCKRTAQKLQEKFASNTLCKNAECLLTTGLSDEIVRAGERFDQSCVGGDVLPNKQDRLSQTVAIYLNGTYMCAGALKNNSITTAKHCFYNGFNVHQLIARPPVEQDNKWFVPITFEYAPLSDVHNKQKVRALLEQGAEIGKTPDVIVFKFSDDAGFDTEQPNILARTQLLSVNRFMVKEQSEIHTAIREYNKPLCSVVAANTQCILHGCTTMPTYSGAPIYQSIAGKNEVVGIHVGAFSGDEVKVCKELTRLFREGFKIFNVAVPINANNLPLIVTAAKV